MEMEWHQIKIPTNGKNFWDKSASERKFAKKNIFLAHSDISTYNVFYKFWSVLPRGTRGATLYRIIINTLKQMMWICTSVIAKKITQ